MCKSARTVVANTLRARGCHGHDLLGHLDIGARQCWIARRVIVHQVDRARPTRSSHSICCACSRPFMAQRGHCAAESQCPLSGVKRSLIGRAPMSASEPYRMSAAIVCRVAHDTVLGQQYASPKERRLGGFTWVMDRRSAPWLSFRRRARECRSDKSTTSLSSVPARLAARWRAG